VPLERAASSAIVNADAIPTDAFLTAYPTGIRRQAERLRSIVRRATPEAIERVRSGWRLIGYDIPVGRRKVYFAWIMPEAEHVHLGFQVGTLMADADARMRGAHLILKKVRYLTFKPGDPIPVGELVALTREAAAIAAMPRQARLALALDRDVKSH
jgi:hypothetical protein